MLPELGVVLDAGTGMFRVRDLIQTKTLDIFLTHIHLDHCIGLTFLYDILFEKKMDRVTVHVAAEKIAAIREHLYAEMLFPVGPNFELRPLATRGSLELVTPDGGKAARLTSIPVEHPGGCHAFRIDWPQQQKSLAYVTDTTAAPDADYVQHIQDVNTLIHECYFPDGWEDKAKLTGHSCLTPVAQVAAAAKAKRCFLVHVNPLDESASPLDLTSVHSIFPEICIAEDRQVIEI